jgi:hypothetical protein
MNEKGKFEQFKEDFLLFLKGAFDFKDKSTAFLKKEAYDAQDNFILLCFGDLLGLPLPTSYYTLELLPYLAEDLETWERRMIKRNEIWQEKWAEFNFFG